MPTDFKRPSENWRKHEIFFLIENTLAALVLAACAQYSAEPLPSVAAEGHAPEQGTGLTEQKLVYAKGFMAASAIRWRLKRVTKY